MLKCSVCGAEAVQAFYNATGAADAEPVIDKAFCKKHVVQLIRLPNPELMMAYQQLAYWWFDEGRCPCGAQRETPDTHPHTLRCPTERALEIMES